MTHPRLWSLSKFCGLDGHEQGGLNAALVAARAALCESPRALKFAVICGAEMPAPNTEWSSLLHRLRDSPDASIETLHCLSRSAAAGSSDREEELAACVAPAAEILWHDGGNAMPGPSWWKESAGFPDRATGRTQHVAGMHG